MHTMESRAMLEMTPESYLALHGVLDEPTSDALLTARELEVRAATRAVVAEHVAPQAAETDRTHDFTESQVRALASHGLMGLTFPAHLGGTEDTNVAYAVAMEEITAGCAATSTVFMTQMHAAYPIFVAGTEEQRRRYIPGLLDGSAWGSLGITEPNAGSDAASLRTSATEVNSGFRLNGSKTFITTGDRADVIILFATVDRALGRNGITAFIVEGDAAGLTRGHPFRKMGIHGSSTAELFLDDVFVTEAQVLGEPGAGWSVLMSSVVKSRISAAAQGVGLARAAYARTVSALNRIHGPQLPAETSFALATLRGKILQGRLLLQSVARQVDTDPEVMPGQIGMMKQSCTDLGWETALECTRILGALGDLAELGVERCLRDAKVTQIYDGTNEVQRLLIGRETSRALKGIV